MSTNPCSVDECDKPRYAHGFCKLHWERVRRTGTTEARSVTGKYVAVVVNGKSEWEHRVIAARVLGHPLPTQAQVHHVDDDGRNNAHGNLVICEDVAYHKELHRRRKVLRAGGNPRTDCLCSQCGPCNRSEFNVRLTGRGAGSPVSYCRSCQKERKDAWEQSRRQH